MILNHLKYLFFFLLTFLLGTHSTYAKTELVLPQTQVSFSIEQRQNFETLKKEVQPNIGFQKEKSKFEVAESFSTQNQYDFSEYFVRNLAEGVDDWISFLGKNIQQLIQHFSIPNLPTENSLTNYQSRIWYHYKKSNIPNLLDNIKSLEAQAQQAFNLRNQYRIQTRDFMSDRNLADFLTANEPNLTWSGYINYLQSEKGLSGSGVWNYIINSASTGRDGVDALFKLN